MVSVDDRIAGGVRAGEVGPTGERGRVEVVVDLKASAQDGGASCLTQGQLEAAARARGAEQGPRHRLECGQATGGDRTVSSADRHIATQVSGGPIPDGQLPVGHASSRAPTPSHGAQAAAGPMGQTTQTLARRRQHHRHAMCGESKQL